MADSAPDISEPIVLFDGVCNLCQATVQFIIKRDPDKRFRFASLQSAVAQQLLAARNHPDQSLSSVLLLDDGRVYRKSAAALAIARQLNGPWPYLYYLGAWVPRCIADRVYDFIGTRRYRWFGRQAACWVPDDDLASRFLD